MTTQAVITLRKSQPSKIVHLRLFRSSHPQWKENNSLQTYLGAIYNIKKNTHTSASAISTLPGNSKSILLVARSDCLTEFWWLRGIWNNMKREQTPPEGFLRSTTHEGLQGPAGSCPPAALGEHCPPLLFPSCSTPFVWVLLAADEWTIFKADFCSDIAALMHIPHLFMWDKNYLRIQ